MNKKTHTPVGGPARPSPKSFIKLSADVSSSYGFRSVQDLERSLSTAERLKGVPNFLSVTRLGMALIAARPTVPTATVMPSPINTTFLSQEPVLIYYASPTASYIPENLPAREIGEFSLSIIGSQESMGEILLIKVITSILEEWGVPISSVRLNALGDKESQQRFTRELMGYLRKHAPALGPIQESRSAESPLEMYRKAIEQFPHILPDAPKSLSFLSEKSRVHFRTILEQLEILGLPYQLDHTLISDDREQKILFAIDLAQSDMTVCAMSGGRYDDLVRRLTGKKELGTVHASIFFRRKDLDRSGCILRSRPAAAKVYFVQLGSRAKLRGLGVVDMLRRARIPAIQSFDSSHLAIQLAAAQTAGVSHVLIMGQREVLDGTIIVRSADQGVQSTIQLSQLPRYLKTLQV